MTIDEWNDENWKKIVTEYEEFIGRQYKNDGHIYIFFGLVHAEDDYYYGMMKLDDNTLRLLSCVGDIEEGHEFILLPE